MMQLYLRVPLAILGLLAALQASAQAPNLARDSAFFRQQVPEYQRWLDHTGLGRTLRIRECEADTLLKVYLQFQYSDPDSVQNAWETLKIETERRQPQTLEALLFFRALGCFDVDRDHLSLRIFDTYDLDKDFCFKRKIYALHGLLTVDSTSRCRGPKKDYVPIQPGDLAKVRPGQKTPPIAKRVTKAAVFEKTKTFLTGRYAAKTCATRRVRTEFTIDAPNLDDQELVVTNLCDEIIREDQPGLCRALRYFGHDCNWKKNEKNHHPPQLPQKRRGLHPRPLGRRPLRGRALRNRRPAGLPRHGDRLRCRAQRVHQAPHPRPQSISVGKVMTA